MPTLVYNGSRYPLKAGINLVGRDQACDIFIPDPHISRKHISIDVVSDGSVTVLDLGSTNGVIVNGDRVPSAILSPGDAFTLGQLTFNIEE